MSEVIGYRRHRQHWWQFWRPRYVPYWTPAKFMPEAAWIPIDTAPLDGTHVQLKFGDDDDDCEGDEDGPYIGFWIGDCWWDEMGTDYGYGAAHPTHWRPLPA